MKGSLTIIALLSLALAVVIYASVGPRQIDSDVIAAGAIGTLIGGGLDQLLPILVRWANRLMRDRPRDGR